MFNTFISKYMLDWLWAIVSVAIIIWSIPGFLIAPDFSIILIIFIGMLISLGVVRVIYELAVRAIRNDEQQQEMLRHQRRLMTLMTDDERRAFPGTMQSRSDKRSVLDSLFEDGEKARA